MAWLVGNTPDTPLVPFLTRDGQLAYIYSEGVVVWRAHYDGQQVALLGAEGAPLWRSGVRENCWPPRPFFHAPLTDHLEGLDTLDGIVPLPAVRPPGGLRVRLGLELRAMDRWQQIAGSRAATSVAVLAVLGLGWDAAFGLRRERADLRAQARGGLRSLPALRSRGPLAAAEREALVAVLCRGAR